MNYFWKKSVSSKKRIAEKLKHAMQVDTSWHSWLINRNVMRAWRRWPEDYAITRNSTSQWKRILSPSRTVNSTVDQPWCQWRLGMGSCSVSDDPVCTTVSVLERY